MDGQSWGDTVTLTGDTETQCNQKEAMASAPQSHEMTTCQVCWLGSLQAGELPSWATS